VKPERLSLGRAHTLATFAIQEARRTGIPADPVVPLGSLRRYAPDVGDVSLLAVAPAAAHDDVLRGFEHLSRGTPLHRTATSVTAATTRGPITVHVTTPADAGAALVWHTGSRPHTTRLAERAGRLGLHFAEGRLTRSGQPVDCADEAALYGALDLPHVPVELREDGDEVETAARGDLPSLVSSIDVRGDLHMHTTWSDGRDSVRRMVHAAHALGYDYLAITDHSQRAHASRALAAADIPRQRKEIDDARARFGGLPVLHGVEVDIMADGSLDFPDEVLVQFDIVLASLHDDAGHHPDQLLQRYLRAARHPLVNVITHPAHRRPAASPGYDLDFDRLFAAAAESGTALEVDGAPGHLDMDGTLARRAVAAGVTITIDSDGHRSDVLGQQMQWGIATARRGWVEARHVLNTGSIDDVRAFVARKRQR
jgi:DNA polymerase (family 10)